MTASTLTTWHQDININGRPYPTRTYVPDLDTDTAAFDLPQVQVAYLSAIHEAGHAVVLLARGGHIHHAEVLLGTFQHGEPDGRVDACGVRDGNMFAEFLAAGERATDRRLREMGLWTPYRGLVAETGAYADRKKLLADNPDVGFGDKPVDYLLAHDMADTVLDAHWPAVLRVADALAHHHRLDGDTIATLAGLPNGPHHTPLHG
ncbi:hypothetical protein [Streptomyces cinereoruber]|uniref:hypothetical protein n=1 Tax=Streptomyces cinereoruber TaxID=67260 RepID=UPI003639D24C